MRYLIATATTVALLISGGALASPTTTPIAGLYNTGAGSSGLLSTITDPYYNVTTTIFNTATYQGGAPVLLTNTPTYIANHSNDSTYIPSSGSATGATGSWIPENTPSITTVSSWLTPLTPPNTSLDPNPSVNGEYTYTTTFNLTGYNVKTAVLSGQWAADNYGTLYLNGNLISTIANPRTSSPVQNDGVAYNSWTSFAAVPNSDFNQGLNTLTFDVYNIGQASGNPTGLRAEFTSSISAVPEPTEGALLLSGIGLLGFVAARRKSV